MTLSSVSMPHAALWVVQLRSGRLRERQVLRFNAARGFVGGAAYHGGCNNFTDLVSMPHAALWVVQHTAILHCIEIDG